MTLESPLDCKKIKSVTPKGNEPWTVIRRTKAEAKAGAKAEASMLWPLDVKNWLIGKDPDAGKGWKQKEKGVVEDEMVNSITNSMDMIWANCGR